VGPSASVSLFDDAENTAIPEPTARMDDATRSGRQALMDPLRAAAALPPEMTRTTDTSPTQEAGPPPESGTLAFWDIMLPEGRTTHPLSRLSAFVHRYDMFGKVAYIGVGIGPKVDGLDDMEFKKWQLREVHQPMINGMARATGYDGARHRLNDRPQTVEDFTFHEMSFEAQGEQRGLRNVILTGVQDGYAMVYWFDGFARIYPVWKRDAVGKAVVE
jgi:hypothetical protein